MAQSQSNTRDSSGRIDILLVDDRPENLVALEASLTHKDYRLISAQSGDEALKYLLDSEPALIIMDVQMPGLDGFETASIIKRNRRTREIPIIFVTAISINEEYAQRAYEHGAVDYIFKPFDARVLASKVAVFVDLHRKNLRLLEAERALRDAEKSEREREIARLEIRSLRREQAQQRRYRDLVESIQTGVVWSIDAEERQVTFLSQAAASILQVPPAEVRSESHRWLAMVHREDRAELQSSIDRAIKGLESVRFSHRMVTPDGRTLWFETALRAGLDPHTERTEIRALSMDVTKLKEAELRSEFLAKASLALARSLEPGPALNEVVRLATQSIARSAAIYRLAEKHLELVASSSEDASAGIPEPSALELRQLLGSPQIEAHVRTLEGDSLPGISDEQLLMVPLRSPDGPLGALTLRVSSTIGSDDIRMVEDLARRISAALDNARLYGSAQSAIRARDEFLSIASHELKTPLTPLKLQIQVMQRSLDKSKELPPERFRRAIDMSDRQISRLTSLIDDLLDLSRIQSGKLALNPARVDALEMLSECIERFRDHASQSGCSIELNAKPGVVVHWDIDRVEQILSNLISNAIKYAPGKPIEVGLSQSDGKARIWVRDQGDGIAESDRDRIFERFERAVPASGVSGLGLGLYIVTEIVRSHHGRIWLESAVGQGSTFCVELPIQPFGAVGEDEEAGVCASRLTAGTQPDQNSNAI